MDNNTQEAEAEPQAAATDFKSIEKSEKKATHPFFEQQHSSLTSGDPEVQSTGGITARTESSSHSAWGGGGEAGSSSKLTRMAGDGERSNRSDINTDDNDHQHYHHNMNMGSIPIQPGELDGGLEFERPLSAPPPPGFGAGVEERNRLATELLWGAGAGAGASVGGGIVFKDKIGGSGHSNNGSIHHGEGTAPNSSHSGGEGSSTMDDRTSSFSNLAAVLGTGLVESMEDATQERSNINNLFAAAAANDTNDPFSSYQRMTRHAASRLIGQQSSQQPPHHHHNHNHQFPELQHNLAQSNRTGIAYSQKSGGGGFPTSLSSPDRAAAAAAASYKPEVDRASSAEQREKEQVVRRSTTPVQMFPGQPSSVEGQRRALPVSRDIGMNVVEPDGETLFQQQKDQPPVQRVGEISDSNRSIRELERGVQNMWSPDAKEFKPAALQQQQQRPAAGSANSSISDVGTEMSPRQAEMDLQPYVWESTGSNSRNPSRTLAILHAAWIRVPDVRAACENFGVLESFRADFGSWGIFFVSYYDIRSAQYAAVELQSILQRLSVMQRSSDEVLVRYCLSLSASSQFNETQISVADLPSEVNEYALRAMLSSYGALRSVMQQDDGSFLVEFHNLQDTKQALLELDSSQPWGPNVTVLVSPRDPDERKNGRELLAMIGRWRHGLRQGSGSGGGQPSVDVPMYGGGGGGGGGGSGPSADPWRSAPQRQEAPHTQYILGPDGRYTPVIVQSAPSSGFPQSAQYVPPGTTAIDTRHQQVIRGPDGQMYIATTVPQQVQSYHSNPFSTAVPPQIVSNTPYGERSGRHPGAPAYYAAHMVVSSTSDANSLSGRSHRSAHSTPTESAQSETNRHLTLELDAVESGQDTRTSLMVRNIPNKYTQQMLLSEFDENGHGPGVIDFFYLPIDFKNRCNRGYAFINFVDYKDILAFHRQYFGKHWRTFNSDKICDITYARIQGKEAMLKRFENSALMEKDDEYKPLVFESDGPRKGKRLPFPDLSKKELHGRRFEV